MVNRPEDPGDPAPKVAGPVRDWSSLGRKLPSERSDGQVTGGRDRENYSDFAGRPCGARFRRRQVV